MANEVEIPGVGVVEFPDEMQPQQVESASHKLFVEGMRQADSAAAEHWQEKQRKASQPISAEKLDLSATGTFGGVGGEQTIQDQVVAQQKENAKPPGAMESFMRQSAMNPEVNKNGLPQREHLTDSEKGQYDDWQEAYHDARWWTEGYMSEVALKKKWESQPDKLFAAINHIAEVEKPQSTAGVGYRSWESFRRGAIKNFEATASALGVVPDSDRKFYNKLFSATDELDPLNPYPWYDPRAAIVGTAGSAYPITMAVGASAIGGAGAGATGLRAFAANVGGTAAGFGPEMFKEQTDKGYSRKTAALSTIGQVLAFSGVLHNILPAAGGAEAIEQKLQQTFTQNMIAAGKSWGTRAAGASASMTVAEAYKQSVEAVVDDVSGKAGPDAGQHLQQVLETAKHSIGVSLLMTAPEAARQVLARGAKDGMVAKADFPDLNREQRKEVFDDIEKTVAEKAQQATQPPETANVPQDQAQVPPAEPQAAPAMGPTQPPAAGAEEARPPAEAGPQEVAPQSEDEMVAAFQKAKAAAATSGPQPFPAQPETPQPAFPPVRTSKGETGFKGEPIEPVPPMKPLVPPAPEAKKQIVPQAQSPKQPNVTDEQRAENFYDNATDEGRRRLVGRDEDNLPKTLAELSDRDKTAVYRNSGLTINVGKAIVAKEAQPAEKIDVAKRIMDAYDATKALPIDLNGRRAVREQIDAILSDKANDPRLESTWQKVQAVIDAAKPGGAEAAKPEKKPLVPKSPAEIVLSTIEKKGELIAAMQEAIKTRAMGYQLDQKEALAKEHGKPFDAYHDLPYAEWAALRDKPLVPPKAADETPQTESKLGDWWDSEKKGIRWRDLSEKQVQQLLSQQDAAQKAAESAAPNMDSAVRDNARDYGLARALAGFDPAKGKLASRVSSVVRQEVRRAAGREAGRAGEQLGEIEQEGLEGREADPATKASHAELAAANKAETFKTTKEAVEHLRKSMFSGVPLDEDTTKLFAHAIGSAAKWGYHSAADAIGKLKAKLGDLWKEEWEPHFREAWKKFYGSEDFDPAKAPSEPPETRGIKNAYTEGRREQEGMPERAKPEERSWEETRQQAEKLSPADTTRIVDDLQTRDLKARPASEFEQWVLGRRTNELENDLASARKSGDKEAVKAAQQRLVPLYDIDERAGEEAGRILNMRRAEWDKDFSIEGIVRKWMKAQKGPLSESQWEKAEKLAKQVEELHKQLAGTAAERDQLASERAAERAIDALTEKFKPSDKPLSKTAVEWFQDKRGSALERMRQRHKDFSSQAHSIEAVAGLAAEDLADLAIIGGSFLAEGAVHFSVWAKRMADEAGEYFNKLSDEDKQKLFRNAHDPYSDVAAKDREIEPPAAPAGKPIVKPPKDKEKPTGGKPIEKKPEPAGKEGPTADDLAAKIEKRFGKRQKFTNAEVRGLARALIEEGVHGRDNVATAVHEILKGIDPDITPRESNDLISGEGTKPKDRDAISKELIDISRQLAIMTRLERAKETPAKPPQGMGITREPPSADESALRAELHEELKKHPELMPERKGLQTAMSTAIKAAQKRLDRLVGDVAAGKTEAKEGQKLVPNKQLADLQEQIKQAKKVWGRMFGKKATDALDQWETEGGAGKDNLQVRQAKAVRRLDKTLADLESAVRNHYLRGEAKPESLTSKAIEARKAEIAKVKAIREELRKADPRYQAQTEAKWLADYKTGLEKRQTKLEAKLAEMQATGKLPEKKPIVEHKLDKDATEKLAKYEQLKRQVDQEADKIRFGRFFPALTGAARAPFMLFSSTFRHLTGSLASRYLFAPLHESVATMLSYLPGVRDVAEGAPVWGGRNFGPLADSMGKFWTKGMRYALEAVTTGQNPLSHYPTNRREMITAFKNAPREIREAFQNHNFASGAWFALQSLGTEALETASGVGQYAASLHEAFKSPAVAAAYEKAFQSSLKWEVRDGKDPTDMQVLSRSHTRAILEANRARLTEENPWLDSVKAGLAYVDKKAFGDAPVMRAAFGVEVPIARVPTNLIGQGLEKIVGAGTGLLGQGKSPGLRQMLRDGVAKFTPEQKDVVMRRLVMGTEGVMLFGLLGFLLRDQIGGLYQRGAYRKKDDTSPEPGTIGPLAKDWTHFPEAETVSFGAQVGKNYDKYTADGAPGYVAAPEAVVAAAVGLLDNFALFSGHRAIEKLATPKGQEEELGSHLTPGFMRDSAPPPKRRSLTRSR